MERERTGVFSEHAISAAELQAAGMPVHADSTETVILAGLMDKSAGFKATMRALGEAGTRLTAAAGVFQSLAELARNKEVWRSGTDEELELLLKKLTNAALVTSGDAMKVVMAMVSMGDELAGDVGKMVTEGALHGMRVGAEHADEYKQASEYGRAMRGRFISSIVISGGADKLPFEMPPGGPHERGKERRCEVCGDVLEGDGKWCGTCDRREK